MKLASIERITALSPIVGADRIEVARVLGYNTVVKKGEFSVNDLCVFHVPDTICDRENPKYSFLEKQGWRLKISKFKGVYSQGLAMPMSVVTDLLPEDIGGDYHEGEDVSDIVKISKYSKPLPEGSEAKGPLPSFIKKTDEPNLLSAPECLEYLRGKFVNITKKMDGQSGTFYLNKGTFGVCSRNIELKDTPNNVFWNIAREYDLHRILPIWAGYGNSVAVQGEIYGPGIQGNHMGANKKTLALFNLFDIDRHKYMDTGRLLDFCRQYGLPMVETVFTGEFKFSIQDLQEMANNTKYDNGSPCEGIVIRPVTECETPLGDRLSVKVISEKFLDKHNE